MLSLSMSPAARRLSAPLLAALSLALPGGAAIAQTGETAKLAPPAPSSQAIEQVVIKLLKSRPELVREALDELQRRELAGNAQQERKALAAAAKTLHDEADATVLGNPAGDVTLVEFIDYHCGYCKKLAPSIEALIQRDGQLRVLVKHLPILGPESIAAAQLALSAGKGATAQQVHKALLSAESIDAASLQAISRQFGLKPVDVVAVNRQLGEVRVLSERLGIQGTPAIVVGDVMFRGAVGTEQLAAAIDAARRAQSAKAAKAGSKPEAEIRRVPRPA
ncbi:thioredoxin domain-containing protein [Roseateles albus]|uniref:Thioredoxin domain-containing protein n=1 Tax=Roseateles albus TaxID=2987525 RepID=A0ABT5KEK2_9BURK|nr:thioredoxin domain-containing protein [Roseateles albus]MDC8772353.1 thioredoxin domain-containing protein [Roseateles albus]